MFNAEITDERMLKHIMFITAKYYLDRPNLSFHNIFRIKEISINDKVRSRPMCLEATRLYGRVLSNIRSIYKERLLTKDNSLQNFAADITNWMPTQKNFLSIDYTSNDFLNFYPTTRYAFENILKCTQIFECNQKSREMVIAMLMCLDDPAQSGYMIDTILWDCGYLFINFLSSADIMSSAEMKLALINRILEFLFRKIIEVNESTDTVELGVNEIELLERQIEKQNAEKSFMEVEDDKSTNDNLVNDDDDEDYEDFPRSINESEAERTRRRKRNKLLKPYLNKLLSLFKAFVDRGIYSSQQFPERIIQFTKHMCKTCSRQHPNRDVFNFNLNVLRFLFEKYQKPRSGAGRNLPTDMFPEIPPLLRGMNRMRDFCTDAELDIMTFTALMIPNTQLTIISAEDHIPFIKTELTRHIHEHTMSTSLAFNWLSSYCEPYWDKQLEPHLEEIVTCLKASIRKNDPRTASTVVHILGKLGGRCRSLLKGPILPSAVQTDAISDMTDANGSCSIEAEFYSSHNSVKFDIQFSEYISRARELAVSENFEKLSNRFPMKSYYTLCRGTLLLFLDKSMPEITQEMLQDQGSCDDDIKLGSVQLSFETVEPNKKSYEDALTAFIAFSAHTDFKDESQRLLDGLLSYFAILFSQNKYENTKGEKSAQVIGAEAIIKAFINLHCSDNKDVLSLSIRTCRRLLAMIESLTGERSCSSINDLWKHYNNQIQNMCVISKRAPKRGSLIALRFLVTNAPNEWLLLNINDVLQTIYLLVDVNNLVILIYYIIIHKLI